jgi:ketosteroid isomerase-like protein
METSEALDALIAALEAADPDRIEPYVHPDFEGVVPASMSAEPDSYRGVEGMRRYFDLFDETVEDLVFRVRPVEQHGEWILIETHITGTGRASGVPVELRAAGTMRMRDGKLLYLDGHPSIEEAQAALAERRP